MYMIFVELILTEKKKTLQQYDIYLSLVDFDSSLIDVPSYREKGVRFALLEMFVSTQCSEVAIIPDNFCGNLCGSWHADMSRYFQLENL